MKQQNEQQANQHDEAIEGLDQAVDLFASVGMPARNLSPRTRQEYRSDLADLAAFLAERGISRLAQIELQQLESYQAEMARRGCKASTRERKTYTVKTLFRFLHHQVFNDDYRTTPKISPSGRYST